MALDPIPQSQALVQDGEKALYMSAPWLAWFYNTIWVRLGQSPTRLGTAKVLTGQHATIGATALPLPSLSAGRYRVSWYARITTVDAVSSSLTVSINWTESTQPLSVSGPAMTGNSVTTAQSGTVLIEVDGNSSISFATTYVSNTPGQMQYRLSVVVEQVP